MTGGINLLLKQNKELVRNQTLEKLLRTITLGVILYCIATVIIFFIYFLAARNNDKIIKEISQVETTVNSFQQKESDQTALKIRTKTITSLISEPDSLYNNLVKIEKIVPPESTIEIANISQQKISYKGKLSTLDQLGYFLSAIETNKNDYSSLIVGPISKETGGEYVFSFEGTF